MACQTARTRHCYNDWPVFFSWIYCKFNLVEPVKRQEDMTHKKRTGGKTGKKGKK